MRPADILDFWFSEHAKANWFVRSEAFDAEIRTRFLSTLEQAQHGELEGWSKDAQGALALTILLDQFPRNLFRNSSRAFASDAKALATTKAAIAQGFDLQLSSEQRQFFYLPFMHSEVLAEQEESLRLYAALGNAYALDYAQQHHAIIARFGRFPHRNAVLGRESTAEELEFLKQPGSSF